MVRASRRVAIARFVAAAAIACGLVAVVPGPSGAAPPRLELEPVAEVSRPTAMAVRQGDDAFYVTTQRGVVVAIRDGARPSTVLDVSELVDSSDAEQGLLGLAFSPDGEHLYVYYTGVTAGESVVEEYAFRGGVADPTTRRVILTVPQPQPNHNGGQLAFGPDGFLYIGLGDGGARSDEGPGHAPGGNAQDPRSLLGKILRIDPTPSGAMPYSIPSGNPFASGGGRPEIYVSGMRNPWRFSFDRKNGDLWIGDVGQSDYEEVTRLPMGDAAGANLGWNRYEGFQRFRDPDVPDAVPPLFATSHDDGNCSIIGGYVYRGRAIKRLRGWYVFTDYCNGTISGARVRDLVRGSQQTRTLGVATSDASSFGQDAKGELYVLSLDHGVFRITQR